ncbi:MAG: DUF5050 domain-containing protein [Acetatifactor sp.]|nr:DUF5050 domain-containing protein [Acetatifactor sp.]
MRKKNTYNTLKVIIVLVVVLLIMALATIFTYLRQRVTMNPPGTVGNTAGNLNNGGFVCEYNGTVYFANAYDGDCIYAMTPSEGDIHKIVSAQTRNILAGGNYLYYFQVGASGETGLGGIRVPRTFNRCDLDGSHATSLVRDVVVTGQLVDNYLYLLAGSETSVFYKIKIDRTDEVQLAEYVINPACAVNGTIYYNGTQGDHYLYALNTANDSSSVVWQGNLWYPIVDGDYVYYLDVANNYRLCRYSFSQDIVEVLTNDRIDCFNVGYGYIYYQTSGNSPQLCFMYTDGTGRTVVADGIYSHINLTSRYAYFHGYNESGTMYHSPLGAGYAEYFTNAQGAVR